MTIDTPTNDGCVGDQIVPQTPIDRAPTATTPAAAATPTFAELRPAYCLLAAPLAVILAGAALVIAVTDGPTPVEIVRPILVVLWAIAGLLLGLRRRHDRLAPIVLGGLDRRSARRASPRQRSPTVQTVRWSRPGKSCCASRRPHCLRLRCT